MLRTLMGLETEYAFSARSRRRSVDICRGGLDKRFLQIVARELPVLRGVGSSGLFLTNGGRLYVDIGGHPEFATAERPDPFEVVFAALAGDRIVAKMAGLLREECGLRRVVVSKSNVDYSGSDATWGCHESYGYARSGRRRVFEGIVPHLVSRICFTGAGGFADGKFTVSPRVRFLTEIHSGSSTTCRPIVHTKNEPLSNCGLNRLHLICGESLCSQWAQALKLGTTSLLVTMLDNGSVKTARMSPTDPLVAMKAFAKDPTWSTRVELEDGRRMSALEMQRCLLDLVVEGCERFDVPAWAPLVCRYWDRALSVLEHDPEAASTAFDWAIKLALFRRYSRVRTVRPTAELCEIDYRFSELGGDGIFEALDEAGVLCHRVPEVGDPSGRELQPPPSGRARLRGQLVEYFHPRVGEYGCEWDHVVDPSRGRAIMLDDPFADEIEEHCFVSFEPISRLPLAGDPDMREVLSEMFGGDVVQAALELRVHPRD